MFIGHITNVSRFQTCGLSTHLLAIATAVTAPSYGSLDRPRKRYCPADLGGPLVRFMGALDVAAHWPVGGNADYRGCDIGARALRDRRFRGCRCKRLRAKVQEAMTMTDGARRVAAGFAATGGVAHGADLIEQRLLGLNAG